MNLSCLKSLFILLANDLKEQYVAIASETCGPAVQIASWSHRLYNKLAEVLFNIQFMVEASCFPSFPRISEALQAGGAPQECRTHRCQ